MKSFRIVVSGRVQGVCFRAFTLDLAEYLGIYGSVRNLPDGTVLIHARGDEDAMDRFLKGVSMGPSYAAVADVRVKETVLKTDLTDFSIGF